MDAKRVALIASAGIIGYSMNPTLLGLPAETSDIDRWENWLKLVQEEAIDTDIPIIDPHHHLWDCL